MTLGPEAREIIDAAEGFDSPVASDKERVRARLAASIGASIVGVAATAAAAKSVSAGTTATAMAKGAGGGVLGSTLLAKILAVFAVAGAVSIGYVAGRRSDVDATRSNPAPAPTTIVTGHAVTPAPAPTTLGENVNPSAADPSLPGEQAIPQPARPLHAPMPIAHGTATPAATTQAPAAAAPQPASHASSAADGEGEAALLQKARAAIDAGDGVTALDALDAHERRFPGGLLADQRQAERVVALCTIAKGATTRERAEHFLAQRPRSQQADRIRRACGLP